MDFVRETLELWVRLRKRAENEGRKCTLSSFLKQWVEGRRGKPLLIAALNQKAVKKALREEGYDFTPIQDEPQAVIRRELTSLIKEPAFAAFKPSLHRTDNPTTVGELSDTAWLEENLRSGWQTLNWRSFLVFLYLVRVRVKTNGGNEYRAYSY